MPRFLSGTFKHEKSNQKEISHKISKTREESNIHGYALLTVSQDFQGTNFL